MENVLDFLAHLTQENKNIIFLKVFSEQNNNRLYLIFFILNLCGKNK